jgi:hypothetical protein
MFRLMMSIVREPAAGSLAPASPGMEFPNNNSTKSLWDCGLGIAALRSAAAAIRAARRMNSRQQQHKVRLRGLRPRHPGASIGSGRELKPVRTPMPACAAGFP